MLNNKERQKAAADLYRAEHERKVIPQLSRTFPKIELEGFLCDTTALGRDAHRQGSAANRT